MKELPDKEPTDDRSWATSGLINAYLSGSGEAERALFDRFRSVLEGHARRRLTRGFTRIQLSAEDAVDEVFVRALASGLLHRFESRGKRSLEHVLVDILDKVLIDQLRRQSAKKRTGGMPDVSLSERATHDVDRSPDPTPTSQARASELMRICHATLDEREWNVWRAVVLEGEDAATVAHRIGSTPAAVRAMLHRARKRIIRRLADGDRTDHSTER